MKWPERKNKEKKRQFFELVRGRLGVAVAKDTWFTIRGDYETLTIVTHGMLDLDQKELIFSLQPGESEGGKLAQDLLPLINHIFEQVCIGNIVDVGGVTVLGGVPGAFFGPDGYEGFIYANPTPYPGMVKYLAAVPLKRDELEVVETYGQTRVLAKLGQRHMFYPFPPFGERKRGAVFTLGDMENSMLGKSPTMRCYDSCVWVSDPGFNDEDNETSSLARSVSWKKSRLTLRVGDTSASELPGKVSQFATHGSLTLLTSVFPDINNCLVYMPPASIPSMIHAGGSNDARCAGNFMTAVQGPQDDVICAEDGFGLLLTESRWIEFLGALESRCPLQIPADGEFPGFELLWEGLKRGHAACAHFHKPLYSAGSSRPLRR